MSISSVIVRDFDLKGISIAPGEADPPLVVDPDAMLPFAAPLQLFQAIARRHAKILERDRAMKDQELPPR
jgi:hypothetical protein